MLDLMDRKRIKPSFTGYASLLQDCSNVKALADGKRIHFHLKKIGYERHRMLANLLIGMYSKCGSLEDASAVFQQIRKKNVYSYTAMIGAYADHRCSKAAFDLFRRMRNAGVKPDNVTFVAILSACCGYEYLAEGRAMHRLIEESGCNRDVVVGNALMNMYGKCGCFVDAATVFDNMPHRDVVSWNTMIATCAQQLPGKMAFDLFHRMQQEGMQPNKITFVNVLEACTSQEEGKSIHKQIIERKLDGDVIVGTAVVNMYRKCGGLQEALEVFSKLLIRDVVSWNAMIAAFAQHGSGTKAVGLFLEMCRQGVKPDERTFVSVLNACNHAGLVDEGCQCFFSMCKDHGITPAVEHSRCVVDLLGRAGRLAEAEHFMRTTSFQTDTLMWMSLLGSCRIHGDVDRGKWAAERLLMLDPGNDAGYVVLANIYSAAGRWDDATKVQEAMIAQGIV
ncbi:hypothetical protein O6H91_07G010000 [Diphasiastrum complanatum]|nr:hypothetical protein O6H91_Y536300 [Diphasiastrum complanatum]KAJ7187425.1 hypothetical protein O6H91_Y536300 [Diphasiastrum complanatum]KAJ7548383.1 hypothetical protein O6H91_07G010000 [Diphasiastrum complanatum]KAJ7548384.1 hypothetical protein O6H91_07G010000 [Diphasiastrum complanatum]KAJ7548386.1 hypothetical protein O6H91_07G010000 [Diphasiastrum complanatum]